MKELVVKLQIVKGEMARFCSEDLESEFDCLGLTSSSMQLL